MENNIKEDITMLAIKILEMVVGLGIFMAEVIIFIGMAYLVAVVKNFMKKEEES